MERDNGGWMVGAWPGSVAWSVTYREFCDPNPFPGQLSMGAWHLSATWALRPAGRTGVRRLQAFIVIGNLRWQPCRQRALEGRAAQLRTQSRCHTSNAWTLANCSWLGNFRAQRLLFVVLCFENPNFTAKIYAFNSGHWIPSKKYMNTVFIKFGTRLKTTDFPKPVN